MPKGKKPGSSVKDRELYELLRDEGLSKKKSARIANAVAKSGSKTSKKGGKTPSYEDWKRDDLRKQAQKVGIAGRSKMKKAELIKALRNG